MWQTTPSGDEAPEGQAVSSVHFAKIAASADATREGKIAASFKPDTEQLQVLSEEPDAEAELARPTLVSFTECEDIQFHNLNEQLSMIHGMLFETQGEQTHSDLVDFVAHLHSQRRCYQEVLQQSREELFARVNELRDMFGCMRIVRRDDILLDEVELAVSKSMVDLAERILHSSHDASSAAHSSVAIPSRQCPRAAAAEPSSQEDAITATCDSDIFHIQASGLDTQDFCS